MAATLGQPVVIENRAGAGGITGVDVIAKAAGDGDTFGIGSAGAIAISPSLGRGTPDDPLRDLAPVSLAALVPEPGVVPAALPICLCCSATSRPAVCARLPLAWSSACPGSRMSPPSGNSACRRWMRATGTG
jgi:hypothetical protein